MTIARCVFAMLLLAVSSQAGVVDVSSAESALLSGGYTISFQLFTNSYSAAAHQYEISASPDLFQFALATAPVNPGQQFAVTLRSAGTSKSVALGDLLDFSPGYLSSAGFQGAISTLQGQFHLDSESQELFRDGTVWLDLTNLGADITLGLPPLLLSHDLYASLSGGPLTVGAVNGAVLLQQPTRLFSAKSLHVNAVTVVPEPSSYWMLIAGAALLLAVYAVKAHHFRVRE